MGNTDRSGLWLFRGALRRGDVFSSLLASCDWVKKRDRTTQHGRFPHLLRVLVRMRTGKAQLSGHRLGIGVGHC